MDLRRLTAFLTESLAIEGIHRGPTSRELGISATFLGLSEVTTLTLCNLQAVYAPDAPLRTNPGMDVVVGRYTPPPGGGAIPGALDRILYRVNQGASPWQTHVDFEKLHPFMDGNGRTGRILWAWSMQRTQQDPFALPFLHRFYYQTLAAQG